MLRNFRSRGRHRYGVFLSAVVLFLLVLALVSLLHSRFIIPLSHRREVNYDSLVSDSANDATGSEDIIDAMDVVEEQPLDAADADEDDESFDQDETSGYFFQQVEGVIRRGFSKSSFLEEVEDEGIFAITEDPAKTAFGSDDVAVDEHVRLKATEAKGVEDALLLKTNKRISPLREGWGDWFYKKGEFLRKDKMLRSNFEALNPLRNAMLQDPDTLGSTGISKTDKLIRNAVFNLPRKSSHSS